VRRDVSLLDYIASAQARDAALRQVSENNADWMSLALLQLEQLTRTHEDWANTEHGVNRRGRSADAAAARRTPRVCQMPGEL
jgi:hypothetical protein